jgi:hypothetical protein
MLCRRSIVPIKRLFLDWSRPLIDEAADRLAHLAESSMPPSLRGVHVVVPTGEAARKLRQALLYRFADRGGIVDVSISSAGSLLRRGDDTISRPFVLTAWAEVLKSEVFCRKGRKSTGAVFGSDSDYATLFPSASENVSPAYLFVVASGIEKMREELAGEGWSISGVLAAFDAETLLSISLYTRVNPKSSAASIIYLCTPSHSGCDFEKLLHLQAYTLEPLIVLSVTPYAFLKLFQVDVFIALVVLL